jgi:hypothetical protein
MAVFTWIYEHWLDILQSLGIISGFLFTAYTIRQEEKARKISHLFDINQHHHSIWRELYEQPRLRRILDKSADLDTNPLTDEEALFVNTLILHLSAVHRAIDADMSVTFQGLHLDIRQFFSLPIPKVVWIRMRPLQEQDFVAFIEECFAETTQS